MLLPTNIVQYLFTEEFFILKVSKTAKEKK